MPADSAPTRNEIETLEMRQSKADARITRVEGQIENLVKTVGNLASTVAESHRESRENFNAVYSKLDGIRDTIASSRAVAWGPMISALVAGAGFVALIVAPIRGRTDANERAIDAARGELVEDGRLLGGVALSDARREARMIRVEDALLELAEEVGELRGRDASPLGAE